MTKREPIGVIGTGYVGLVTAAGFAELGSEVYCVDIDASKIAQLERGEIPIYEPGLAELVDKNRPRMHFSTDLQPALEHARLLFVAVGTPPTYSGDADLSAVHAVVDAMPPSDRHALVMKSTVPSGTGAAIKRIFAERGKGGFRYVSCPEFLKEGSAVADFLHPDRVVVGDDGDWAGDAVVDLYAPRDGRTELLRLDRLWDRLESEHGEWQPGVVEPENLEVLSWVPGAEAAQFLPVMALTQRDYEGDLLDVRTKMGRRVRCTPDHPWIVGDGKGAEAEIKLAESLTTDDWVPLALGRREGFAGSGVINLLGAVEAAEVDPRRVIVRIGAARAAEVAARPIEERRRIFAKSPSRMAELKRCETMRLDEAWAADLPVGDTTLGAARNGAFVPTSLPLDRTFWRIVGLYIAEGCCTFNGDRGSLFWSFHREREQHLVDEVVAFWMRNDIIARSNLVPTSHKVTVNSRLLAAWWTQVLGLGRNSYEQRLPDLIWDRPDEDKWTLLSGLWEGDGSWSLVNGGPSVILEFRTISDELADGVHRLLGDLGIVASQRIRQTKKSTKDTHWLRISGADQVERAIELVPGRDQPGVLASVARQSKRIAPTGYRRFNDGPAWLRVTDVKRQQHRGSVYSLEVPGSHTVITSHGISVHQCFPKDVSALKQLAGNSGYHFQLLTAVIEVNELQKRRVISKLQKHLGSLAGREVALLGLAFKPNTDDMREASSLVLAGRLEADGARVRAYDPVAEDAARGLMQGVDFSDSALSAVDGADAVVLVTEWPEFVELDWAEVASRMRGDLVIDGRNALDGARVAGAGLVYEGIGRR